MFAVIRTGGKQYKVAKDAVLQVENLAGDVGAKLNLEVLMLGGDTPKIGAPLVKGASVAVRNPRPGQGREGHRLQEEAPQEHASQARPPPALHQSEVLGITAG